MLGFTHYHGMIQISTEDFRKALRISLRVRMAASYRAYTQRGGAVAVAVLVDSITVMMKV